MNVPSNLQKIAAFKQGLIDRGEMLTDYCRQHGLNYDAMQMVLQGRSKGRRGNAHKVYVALGLRPETQTEVSVYNQDPHGSDLMNETSMFPDALRVSTELNWVYTSSSRVAQVFDLPHQMVVEHILELTDQLVALGDEVEKGLFRYGLLTYQGQGLDDEFEILLCQGLFWLMVMTLDGETVQQFRRMAVDRFRRTQSALDRLKTQMPTAQA